VSSGGMVVLEGLLNMWGYWAVVRLGLNYKYLLIEGSCEHPDELHDSINRRQLRDQLDDWQHIKNNFAVLNSTQSDEFMKICSKKFRSADKVNLSL
jgi:hypothetical protein